MKLNRDRWRGGSMQRGRRNKRLDSGLKLYEFRKGGGVVEEHQESAHRVCGRGVVIMRHVCSGAAQRVQRN